MKTLGFDLRLGEHEVNDFTNSAKVHLHFEKFDQSGTFYNYTLYVDLTNIRLPYNPIDYEDHLTIGKALKKAAEVSSYDYGALAEIQSTILTSLTDILPIEEGSDAYQRLLNNLSLIM